MCGKVEKHREGLSSWLNAGYVLTGRVGGRKGAVSLKPTFYILLWPLVKWIEGTLFIYGILGVTGTAETYGIIEFILGS